MRVTIYQNSSIFPKHTQDLLRVSSWSFIVCLIVLYEILMDLYYKFYQLLISIRIQNSNISKYHPNTLKISLTTLIYSEVYSNTLSRIHNSLCFCRCCLMFYLNFSINSISVLLTFFSRPLTFQKFTLFSKNLSDNPN